MIDYETFCKIHDCHDRQGLTIAQTARALGLDPRTVATWVARLRFEPRRSRPRGSVLDPFKPRITRLLDTHPYSAQQIFQRLREEGYRGGVTILRDYVHRIRPIKRPVYLKLHFAPGECAQIDWGVYGTVAVGNTRRRLSFFVMVLAFSRQMFVEFTVSQTMEHFLACHEHGFAALGVPSKVMVDNLKSAVLQRLAGAAPVFNPRYLDFARHHGFAIEACNVACGNEKGRVESGVGYVKKNFLHGLELTDFSTIHAAAQVWLDTIANVRIHRETQQRPVDLLAQERPRLGTLNPNPYALFPVDGLNSGTRHGRVAGSLDFLTQGKLIVFELNDQMRVRGGRYFEGFFWQCIASHVMIWPATSSSSNSFCTAGISLDFSSMSICASTNAVSTANALSTCFALASLKLSKLPLSALPSNAITRAPEPAASTFRWAACSRKAISTSVAVSPCKIYRMAVCAGGLFQLILKALFSFRRWTLMKVRMPRYELAPLTIAKMENNRTCGS